MTACLLLLFVLSSISSVAVNVVRRTASSKTGSTAGKSSFCSMQKLCKTAQATITTRDVSNLQRKPKTKHGNRLFQTPYFLSTVFLTRICIRLYRCSSAVIGFRKGVIRYGYSLYPPSPRRTAGLNSSSSKRCLILD